MHLKKIDFVIIVMLITTIILLLDNFYFGQGFFDVNDLHHETWVVALVFGTILIITLRKLRML